MHLHTLFIFFTSLAFLTKSIHVHAAECSYFDWTDFNIQDAPSRYTGETNERMPSIEELIPAQESDEPQELITQHNKRKARVRAEKLIKKNSSNKNNSRFSCLLCIKDLIEKQKLPTQQAVSTYIFKCIRDFDQHTKEKHQCKCKDYGKQLRDSNGKFPCASHCLKKPFSSLSALRNHIFLSDHCKNTFN